MEQNGTSSSNPAPGRGVGSTTSAMMRDAARLRSVMGRGEPESQSSSAFEDDRDRLIPEVDRDIAMPALGAEARAAEPRRSLPPEAPAQRDEASHPHATPTTLRTPAIPPRRRTPIASPESSGEATTLRPVDALKELEERARIAAAAKKMAPRGEGAQMQGASRERVATQEASRSHAVSEIESRGGRTVEPEDIRRRPRHPRSRSLMGAVTVFAGTAIGLGLYAGGGDLLSRFFSNKNEGVMMENPAAVTERPDALIPPPAASSMPSAGSGGTAVTDPVLDASSSAPSAASVAADKPVADKPIADKPVDARPVLDKPVAERPVAAKPAQSKAPAEKSSTMVNNLGTTSSTKPVAKPTAKAVADAKSAKPTDAAKSKAATKPASATYVVQVRATTDEAEANRIARKLRAKGVKDVKVDLSQRNGVATYRIRYGSFSSSSEAKSSAGRAGVSDAWVVKK